MSLSSKAAIVTGTANAGGIGFAIAKKLASLGYVVLGVDVAPCANPPPANSDRYAHYVGDVSSVDACRAIWNTFTSSFPAHQVPSIDCIVNNAAIANPYMPKGVQERFEQWQKTLNVNLTGPFLLTETLKPHLTPRASIVHISSTRALMSEPESEAYAATKAGLLGLAHAQAISLAGQARVNTILPGWINTGPNQLSAEDHAFHPAGRVGTPDDIANLVAFLADDAQSGFITGQQFVVDGGVTRKMIYPE